MEIAERSLCNVLQPKGKSSSDLKDKNDKREEGSAKGNEADDADDKISTKSEFDWTRTQLSQAGSENVSESDGLIISPIMEAAQLASWGRIERAGSADTVGSKKTVSWKEDSSQMASQTPHGSGLTLRSTGALDGVSRTGSGDSSNALQKVEEEEEETADPQACLMRAVKRVKELHADIIRQADRWIVLGCGTHGCQSLMFGPACWTCWAAGWTFPAHNLISSP
jgi:hypothetical protein